MADTFSPDFAIHPGETVRETMETQGMNQTELAERTGLHRKTINGLVNGRESLTPDTALQLEKVFRVPARFWTNLQTNYDETIARQKERARLTLYRSWIKERAIPYAELVRRGCVASTRDPVERLRETLKFFGLSSPENFDAIWEDYEQVYAFRRSDKVGHHFGAIAAWLRLGELKADTIDRAAFDRSALRAALTDFRAMTRLSCEEFPGELVELCAQCGVLLVFVPGIRGAPIYGATRWLHPHTALVQLSLRGKDDGHFWFTFFHELGHVLLHGKSAIFLELDEATHNREEEEANAFARDLLIPPQSYQAFLRDHPRRNACGHRLIKNESISRFAEEIGIAPGIVVGRLQREGEIAFSQANHLKQRIEGDPNL